ncbi:MAG: AAA family ATPase [Pseudomonadota bacterium]
MTAQPSAQRRARILAIANQKGGVGKTTTAINLATGLADAGKRCLIIDLDPQGNASTGLGFPANAREITSYNAIAGETDLTAALTETGYDNLHLVPASVDLSGLDAELIDDPDRATRLQSLIEDTHVVDIRSAYDYILIDCPPSLNLLTVNAMVAADSVIVPLQCEFFALEGLTQLLETVRIVQGNLNPGLKIRGIVLTMFDQRNRLSFQVAEDVRENLGDIVFDTIIPRNVRLSEAPSYAMPALKYDASCAGSKAYVALTAELLAGDGHSHAA